METINKKCVLTKQPYRHTSIFIDISITYIQNSHIGIQFQQYAIHNICPQMPYRNKKKKPNKKFSFPFR